MKAFGLPPIPHIKGKFCTEGLLGRHALCMLGRILIRHSVAPRLLIFSLLFSFPPDTLDDDDEVLWALAEQLGEKDFVVYVGGADYAHTLLVSACF